MAGSHRENITRADDGNEPADTDLPAGGEGVIVAEADMLDGFALHVQDGKRHYAYSLVGMKIDAASSSGPLPTGKTSVRFTFTPTSQAS